MEVEIDNCDVQQWTENECHLGTFSNSKKLHNIVDLSNSEKLLLKLRIDGLYDTTTGTICHHHLQKYLNFYSLIKKVCCDPFKTHRSKIMADLRTINMETCQDSLKFILIKLIPGDKYCKTCQNKISSLIEKQKCQVDSIRPNVDTNVDTDYDLAFDNVMSRPYNTRQSNNATGTASSHIQPVTEAISFESQFSHGSQFSTVSTDSTFTTMSQDRKQIENILQSLGISLHHLDSLQNKESVAPKIMEEVIAKFGEKLSASLQISLPIAKDSYQNLLENNESFLEIMHNLQEEFKKATVLKKIEILSLLPKNWSYSTISQFFQCSEYMYRKLLKYNRDIDAIKIFKRKQYTKISPEVQNSIEKYYVDENNCRVCPGKKEYVTVVVSSGKKICVQKKLLLYTVHDLYINFTEDYHHRFDVLPKFSYFAALRPRECIVAGDPGSHSICVCEEHENIKLKLSSYNKDLKYRDLLEIAFCSTNNIECMLHRCSECPGEDIIRKMIDDSCTHQNANITYKCWVNEGSRASLSSITEKVEDFKKTLVTGIWNLGIHHFIADSQKHFFEQCKRNLTCDTCIIIMDFSENYSFIIQNSVQAFYYNNAQATIHPFVIYYKKNSSNELQSMNYCIISDTKDHFAYTVYTFLEKLMNVLKNEFPWIREIIYFSDGAPTQYKNKNHLANICCHENDFGINVKSYNFFATSHGKTSCDGIGGTVKRTVMRHCLRSPSENQITTPLGMYEYLSRELKSIRSLWVSDEDVKRCQKALSKRFSDVKTIPQTRKHHSFIPREKNIMDIKITSMDIEKKSVTLNI